jgi:hypothetical protein
MVVCGNEIDLAETRAVAETEASGDISVGNSHYQKNSGVCSRPGLSSSDRRAHLFRGSSFEENEKTTELCWTG